MLARKEEVDVPKFIEELKEGKRYDALIESNAKDTQRFENAEISIETKVIEHIEQRPSYERDDLYDLVFKTTRFPTFRLASKIATSELGKQQFMAMYSLTERRYDVAYSLMQKVPSIMELRARVKNINKKINSENRGTCRRHNWK